MWKYLIAASGFGLMVACQPVTPSGHSHGDTTHSHGTEADHAPAADGNSVTITRWTEEVELFAEFPPLIVGQVSRFSAHVTRIADYQPVKEGQLTVSLIVEDKGIRQTVDAPTSPGIFTPALQPTQTGKGRLIFDLTTPDFSDRILLENIRVYSDPEEAASATTATGVPANTIDFLKEQAWRIDFQVRPVISEHLSDVIRTTGKILPMPDGVQVVAAPSSGIVAFPGLSMLPGRAVRKGELLFSLTPTGDPEDNLKSRLAEAMAALQKAEAEYLRRKDLLEDQAVSPKAFEESELAYEQARIKVENLKSYLPEGGRKVFAPQSGYIRETAVNPGAFVETGNIVLSISRYRKLQLLAELPQQYYPLLGEIEKVTFRTLYGETFHSMEQYNGQLISHAPSISPGNPFIPVYFELDNRGDLLPGAYVELFLHTGEGEETLTVPRTALIEEYGNYYVVVQRGGETFEKRAIRTGIDNGTEVQVLHGLRAGEMIVTRGAYQVKMASMAASLPAHGHTH